MNRLTYMECGRRMMDCRNCGQAARVDVHGNRVTVRCFAKCDQDVALQGVDLEQLVAEVKGKPVPVSDNGVTVQASTLVPFAEVVAKPVRWAWRDRVALAKISALAGRPKIGKGLLYADLIARATRGELDADLDGPRNVTLVTTEDDPGDTLKPRLMAAGADLSRVSIFQMGSRDEPVPFRVPQDAGELSRRVAEKDAALVVIDPLMEFIDGKVDSHKSHPVRQAIAALNQIARDTGCAVLVVFHLNKGVSTDPLLRHEGSAAFTQVVRGGLMLGHDPDDPDAEDGNQRVLAVSSSNLAAPAPSIVYRIDTAHVQGDTGEEITTARVVPIGESGANAHDLLKGRDGEERTGTDEAVEFLEEELSGGPRQADEIIIQARHLGISEKMLRAARGRLGIKPTKTGFRAGWEWALPEGSLPSEDRGHLRENGDRGRLREIPLVERDAAPPPTWIRPKAPSSMEMAPWGHSGLRGPQGARVGMPLLRGWVMRSKLVYPGGWIWTTYLSRRFPHVDPTCELCRRATCGPYWLHLERRVVRCYRCQTEDDLWREATT